MRYAFLVVALSCLLFPASRSIARRVDPSSVEQAPTIHVTPPADKAGTLRGPQPLSGTGTIASWDFENPAIVWTSVDRTAQGAYFHVDSSHIISGTRSLWCGVDCATLTDACLWPAAPGYGNDWNQCFESNAFAVSGNVTVDFQMNYDLEPSYDYAYLEYAGADAVWHVLDSWTGTGSINVDDHILGANYTSPLKIRIRVKTDGSDSDEDGFYPSNGAVVIDNLLLLQNGTLFNSETFELDAPGSGATADGIWHAVAPPAAGDHAGVFNGAGVLQEDIAYTDNTKLYGFFNASPDNYSCGGHPTQAVVPFGSYVDLMPKFVRNEIQSPPFSIVAYPTEPLVLGFDWYADMPNDNLVYIYYGVRSRVGGTWHLWKYSNTIYYNPTKSWLTFGKNIRPLIEAGATDLQVAIGARDLCELWCGTIGSGACHSQGPLIDNVRVTQANTTTGTNVSVTPVDATTGTTPVTVTFSNVTSAGLTTLTTGGSGPSLPAHFLLGNSIYYNINNTTTSTGLITITIVYNPATLTVPENTLRLLHWDASLTPDGWVDITTSLNTATHTIVGQTTSLSPFVIGAGSVTGVGDTPRGFALDQNIPNPFNPTTTITYEVPGGGGNVSIAVYDATGSLVRTLVNEHRPAGKNDVIWDGRGDSGAVVSSGVYFYRLTSGSFTTSRRMVLLK